MKHKLYESYMNGEGFTYMVAEGKSFTHDDRIKLSDPLAVFNLAKSLNAHKFSDEHVFCFCVNTRLKFLAAFEVSSGGASTSIIPVREIFQKALLLNATGIILVHNHPGGSNVPSDEDIAVTKRIASVGELLGIPLCDHVIISSEVSFNSAKEQNWL